MTIGERIRKRRIDLGYSVSEIADKIGKNRATVYRYETEEIYDLPTSVLEPLANALQTTPSYLMGWEDEDFLPANVIPIPKMKRVPMLGDIACGEPIFAEEQFGEYIEADIKADFCLRATGDSMIGARILDGDIVFIRKQEMVENGEIAAVLIENEATLKRVYFYPEKAKIILSPENPKYEPFVYVGEELNEIKILGKAIAFQSSVR
jgi:repressor LexA